MPLMKIEPVSTASYNTMCLFSFWDRDPSLQRWVSHSFYSTDFICRDYPYHHAWIRLKFVNHINVYVYTLPSLRPYWPWHQLYSDTGIKDEFAWGRNEIPRHMQAMQVTENELFVKSVVLRPTSQLWSSQRQWLQNWDSYTFPEVLVPTLHRLR